MEGNRHMSNCGKVRGPTDRKRVHSSQLGLGIMSASNNSCRLNLRRISSHSKYKSEVVSTGNWRVAFSIEGLGGARWHCLIYLNNLPNWHDFSV
jgi:hypothetical protein